MHLVLRKSREIIVASTKRVFSKGSSLCWPTIKAYAHMIANPTGMETVMVRRNVDKYLKVPFLSRQYPLSIFRAV